MPLKKPSVMLWLRKLDNRAMRLALRAKGMLLHCLPKAELTELWCCLIGFA